MMKNVLLSLTLLVLVSCSGGRNSTGYSIINDMKYSEAHEAFTETHVFDNGQVMQEAPKKTIARGWLPHAKDSDGNSEVLLNPFNYDEYAAYRGEKLFKITCMPCHGAKGKADGLVVKVGGFPKPPSFKARRWKKVTTDSTGKTVYKYGVGNIYNVITNGIGNMPSHSQQLSPEDRWAVSEFVRRNLMKKSKKVSK
jgi:mono/diheme cytochrome c family protein